MSRRLVVLGVTMRSPKVTAILQEGLEIIGEEVRRRAPVGATGNLRAGVYTASPVKNNFRQLTRRNGRRVNVALKYPPRRGQVLLVGSTFYARWVEKGRKPGKGRHDRTVGRQFTNRKRGKPFFRPAVRAKRREAEQAIQRKLDALIHALLGG